MKTAAQNLLKENLVEEIAQHVSSLNPFNGPGSFTEEYCEKLASELADELIVKGVISFDGLVVLHSEDHAFGAGNAHSTGNCEEFIDHVAQTYLNNHSSLSIFKQDELDLLSSDWDLYIEDLPDYGNSLAFEDCGNYIRCAADYEVVIFEELLHEDDDLSDEEIAAFLKPVAFHIYIPNWNDEGRAYAIVKKDSGNKFRADRLIALEKQEKVLK